MWRWIGAIGAVAVLAVLAMGGGAQQAPAADESKTAIFAGGCFWCVEAAFDEVPGVTETVSGYAGGTKPNPNYGDHEGYQEAVKVTYDPAKVTYAKLLDTYWHNIDPFDANGQFCDQGNAYRSVIFVGNDEEKGLAESTEEAGRRPLQGRDGGDGDQAGDDFHRGRGLSSELSQHESGELQVLQMELRTRPAARAALGAEAVVMPHPCIRKRLYSVACMNIARSRSCRA